MFFFAVTLWMQMQAARQTGQGAGTSAAGKAALQPVPMRQVKVQVITTPKVVTIGEHFTVTVRVSIPAGIAGILEFPAGPNGDAGSDSVMSAAPMQRHDSTHTGVVDATATYTLSAWYPGVVRVALGDLNVARTSISVPDDSVLVSSVLPENPAARAKAQPKQPRPLIGESLLASVQHYLKRLLLLLAVLLLVIGAILLLLRFRRRKKLIKDIAAWAEGEFRRIEGMHLLDGGEPERHAILMSAVLRQYLIGTFSLVRESATTRELESTLRSKPLIPAERVLTLFERVDLLKFAHSAIQTNEASWVATESRAIVNEILEGQRKGILSGELGRASQNGLALAIIAVAVLSPIGCDRLTPSLRQTSDTANVARYNRGTKLLGHDSLRAALTRLDSALHSRDSVVKFRSAFNGGWDHLVGGIRTLQSIKGGKANSSSVALGRDTTLVRSTAADYSLAELDSSLVKYRAALVTNPADVDAKWNYELALLYRKAAKSSGGRESKGGAQQSKNQSQSKAAPSTGQKGSNNPLPEPQHFSLQQAQQLLDAMGQREQQAAKTLPVPVTPPPAGKDW